MSASCTTDLDSPACPPLVRRLHKSVIVGLAIFFGVIIALGEPFRGYQAEVRLSGPTSDAINFDQVRDWITRTDSQAAVAIARQTSGNARVEIRVGRVATRLTSATQVLDNLARRLLTEELPQQHAAHRQSVLASVQEDLQAAREAEEALRSRAAELREEQLAPRNQSPQPQQAEAAPLAEPPQGFVQAAPPEVAAELNPAAEERRKQLDSLRLELARLLASFTEEHPQVLAIQRQIDSLEQPQASAEARNRPLDEGPELSTPPGERAAAYQDLRSPQFVSVPAGSSTAPSALANLTADLITLQQELSLASKHRALVEERLQTMLASLASTSPTAAWSAEPARIVARLGGTPRMLPVMLAIVASVIAGVIMFRATRILALPRVLQTASDLAATLPIPLVGRNPSITLAGPAAPRLIVTPSRVRFVTKAAEAVLLTILAVCVCAIFLDPTLASEFALDPLGVVSEIFGRVLGR